MKRPIIFLFLVSFFCFSSCEEIVECIINKRPELPDKRLEDGYTNSYYTDELIAEIKNEPHDDDYGYFFDLYGDLPEGLDMIIDYRKVIFEGLPTEKGTYNFTIYLSVDPPEYYDDDSGEYEDSLCSSSSSKSYTIIIH
jgi:hypothetical protein